MKRWVTIFQIAGLGLMAACGSTQHESAPTGNDMEKRLSKYITVRLTSDLNHLSEAQKRMIPLLIEAAQSMDEAFWIQAYGDRQPLLADLDERQRRYAEINYGPWDRLEDNQPFIEGVGAKPAGANFYPRDMSKEEFEAAAEKAADGGEALKSLYTMVRRDGNKLTAIPYSEFFAQQHTAAAAKLREAAASAQDVGFRKYLELRAAALLDNDYQASDLAWMDMKSNALDLVIGPIETYEDQLFGYKAGHEAYVLVKDLQWSRRLSKYSAMLPQLQTELPVEDAYKQETPGLDSDLNAYDVIFAAGDGNAASKTIAINLPNDEEVQLRKGTRRLQLKNAMRAKFDKILVPIAKRLIASDQQERILFDAFFSNVMFHEVAHGLGIKNTIDGRGTVREALKERASALEEAKADVLGLFMVTKLIEKGELAGTIQDNYITFLASLFRSVRFGSADAHGRANLAEFNFLQEQEAFAYDPATQTYALNAEKMSAGVDALARRILTLQGDGDYDGVTAFMQRYGTQDDDLRNNLERLDSLGIPVDIVFDQGVDVLGLQ